MRTACTASRRTAAREAPRASRGRGQARTADVWHGVADVLHPRQGRGVAGLAQQRRHDERPEQRGGTHAVCASDAAEAAVQRPQKLAAQAPGQTLPDAAGSRWRRGAPDDAGLAGARRALHQDGRRHGGARRQQRGQRPNLHAAVGPALCQLALHGAHVHREHSTSDGGAWCAFSLCVPVWAPATARRPPRSSALTWAA